MSGQAVLQDPKGWDAAPCAVRNRPVEPKYRVLHYAQATAVASVGTKGYSYDDTMAKALNSLYKAELIFLDGPGPGRQDSNVATAQWVPQFNTDLSTACSTIAPGRDRDRLPRHNCRSPPRPEN
ncbi:hypothetical protein LQ384_27810 [Rhodococcus rhodochrous]|uniref:Uncharacterized protein n=1 Tax=Rhodococcus rhodochrous TaxID=1829 RepID=A0AAW4XPG7_RHORH|nr:hypothetical protein [Rhodococcus rhodochrous]MCD2114903.1 hypothetical protein [Rhodococcus rhodochrous]